MNRSITTLIQAISQISRPLSLLAGVLLYALGGGITMYLGEPIDWTIYWTGQGAVTLLQLSAYFLGAYFDRSGQPPFEPPEIRAEEDGKPARIPRQIFLQIGATTLTIFTVLTFLLIVQKALNPPALLILALAIVMAVIYAVPPFRLVYSGYGELVLAVLMTNVFPAIAFLLQTGMFHRLLAMMTFPLTLLYLAATLARSLQRYAEDIRLDHHTMLTRLGWQRGMNIHNVLIAAAYVLLAGAVINGLPSRLAIPAFLSMPVGLFQIWQMISIANGAKPRWRMLALTSSATVGLMAYFMNLALWTD